MEVEKNLEELTLKSFSPSLPNHENVDNSSFLPTGFSCEEKLSLIVYLEYSDALTVIGSRFPGLEEVIRL